MAEQLKRVIRSSTEEIRISLHDPDGDPHLELRVYARSGPAREPTATPEGLMIPLSLLPVLVRDLSHTQDALVQRGLIYVPPEKEATHMAAGETAHLSLTGRYVTQAARRHPRVALRVPIECRVFDDKNFWPTKPVTGELRDLSEGGAQVSLVKRIPRFSQVEIFLVADKLVFRGRAEVVAADVETQTATGGGHFRHSLRWIALEGHARDVLRKIVTAHQTGDAPPAEPTQPE
jgi:hypothetical protein